MKKVFFTIALLFVSFLTMNAQDGEKTRVDQTQQVVVDAETQEKFQTAQEMADKETARQTKRFGLTPEQAEQAKVINFNYCQQKFEMIRKPQGESREYIQMKLKEIKKAQIGELKAILTPDQQAKLIRSTNSNNEFAEPEEKTRSNQPQPNNRARNRNN